MILKKYLLTAFTLLATCNSIVAMDQTPKHALCDILPHYKTPLKINLDDHNQDAADDSQIIPHYALKGHTDTVWKITTVFDDTTDTTFVISASADTTIKIWNLEQKECIKTWHEHTASVNTAKKVMIDEDFFIASGSDDTTIRLWQTWLM